MFKFKVGDRIINCTTHSRFTGVVESINPKKEHPYAVRRYDNRLYSLSKEFIERAYKIDVQRNRKNILEGLLD